MITGTADPAALAAEAATLARLDASAITLPGTDVLQAAFEMGIEAREASVPPGLHPTNPPMLVVLAWRCPESPWGPFTAAQARVSCRSGVRPRGFVRACVVDSDAAADALRADWGLPAVTGTIDLRPSYHGPTLEVSTGGRTVLSLAAFDPVPLDPNDVQYTVTMTLAGTPRGVRLVQLEPEYTVSRAERVKARLDHFSWDAALSPWWPVSATIATADITIPPLRFLCRPDVTAFEGTERI